jgi:hypothetical protein
MSKDFDLVISRDELNALAPKLLEVLRDFVGYGLCRQNNAYERKALAERFAALAKDAMKKFPGLKLNHMGAETFIAEDHAEEIAAHKSACKNGYHGSLSCWMKLDAEERQEYQATANA